MIVNFILRILYGFIGLLVSPLLLFADVSLDSNISAAISQAGQYLNMVDIILPAATLIAILGLFLTIEASILTYKMFMWVKNLIW